MSAMRIFALTSAALPLALILLTSAVPAAAAEKDVIVEQTNVDTSPKQRLDQLFSQLKRERDPEKASGIANEIRLEWNDSGSATINLLMQWADKAIEEKRNPAALDFLDEAITLKPDYAESWNRRATLNFIMGNYRKSMSDIEHVLDLEPRHFGALSGMAAILSNAGNDQLALKAWEQFLSIYPAERTAQEQVNTLSEKLAGNRT
ncbi:tetratricopeptide repeat protein [Rhizobium fabae]|uniref:Tetratricopeptide (TPR) repeat protein n=1 Tax=Rhizobium fabae TaxID=573179 RepID=A0A7W6FIW1_9HYPH|nr:tetratricopeptide repeat protein [Rhizobium fabae]MBB3915457.1 tetratricopeptide (TPR) repeat protein [Rhizobium fabae]RUM11949.1 tetratricopeptide repeat protein [Rhizobium fabae]